MCKCTCRRGPQGATGATGDPAAPSFSKVAISSTNVTAQTDLTIVASASQTGNIIFFGQLFFDSLNPINYTVSVLINGSVIASSDISVTGASSISARSYVVIPVSNLQAITAGQEFALRVILSNYTESTSVIGNIQYAYQ